VTIYNSDKHLAPRWCLAACSCTSVYAVQHAKVVKQCAQLAKYHRQNKAAVTELLQIGKVAVTIWLSDCHMTAEICISEHPDIQ